MSLPTNPASPDSSLPQLRVDGQPVPHRVEGRPAAAEDNTVLLSSDVDLSAQAPWATAGFAVVPGLPGGLQAALQAGLAELLREALRNVGCAVAPDFDISQYHRVIGDDAQRHLAVIAQTKAYELARLRVAPALLEALVSAACGQPVRAYNPNVQEAVFHLRIVRPHRADQNPLHRDAWLPRYRHALNIYLPVAGSTAQSSLALVPGSHHWPESAVERTAGGAIFHGVPYTVPGVLRPARPLELMRPNPGPDEVLVFSPYLLHGAAANLNPDATRVSLEMRFWRA
ncbi:phytanoyl-CoA dioxygenase family protein [Hymenobacter armeniacus]|uniref:Phytanoyl-CoA dioxygenase family protein n=1 Tax=Hymenobacter armeniacus TaxID=2771358 RepID=A0ABR8JRC2_9BACT|nr:phytanoyl-CoA dioxygenase family protein [Hymenobacter armeniacus]MBD2721112.1 phytanoyl-CoA dioxygenase family protein [Hymenobacter armeniacus]